MIVVAGALIALPAQREDDLHRLRGSGPDGDQLAGLLAIKVREFRVTPLTS